MYTTFNLSSTTIGTTFVLLSLHNFIQNELYLTSVVCGFQDLTKISCKMPLVICVVLFLLEKQLGALGSRCLSAEEATKRKLLQFKVPVNFFQPFWVYFKYLWNLLVLIKSSHGSIWYCSSQPGSNIIWNFNDSCLG